jgi:hypothetical protein
MKAIKIPNTSLLDVFGRPVTINSQDFHRASFADRFSRDSSNNHQETNSKNSNPGIKPDNTQRLTIIGSSLSRLE